ncbi:MAG TPA: type II toxin-antitoxin system VapC family toxin [Thermoanaerobaculia bacterium]
MKIAATAPRRAELSRLLGPLYCDASALVKLYVPEAGSDELNQAVEGRRDLLVSDLSITEIVSSLSCRRREGALEARIVSRLHRTILGHVEAGVYRKVELISATHREAERLLLSVEAVPLRAADALHLALAVAGDAASLMTYDRRLAGAGRAIGLSVFP